MNDLKIFNNSEFGDLTVLVIDGIEWFVAKEVAEMLGYTTLQRAYNHLDKEDTMKINPQSLEFKGLCENGRYPIKRKYCLVYARLVHTLLIPNLVGR